MAKKPNPRTPIVHGTHKVHAPLVPITPALAPEEGPEHPADALPRAEGFTGDVNAGDVSINPLPTTAEDMIALGEGDEVDLGITDEAVEQARIVPPSRNALELDAWDAMQGQRCLEGSEVLRAAFPGLRMDLLDDRRKAIEDALSDLHGCAYLVAPQPVEKCVDERRLEYVRTLLESPECKVLRESTVTNNLASELATTQFGVAYAELVKADEQRAKNPGKGPPNPERDKMKSEMALRRAVAKGVEKAKQEVDDLEDVSRGLGGDGSLGNNPNEAKKIADAYKRIRGDRNLKAIFERAGKFRRFMQSAQRRKVKHGVDDVVGTELSGDVHRLLPVEMARLADEDMELDTLRRIVERQAMCRTHQGVERVARGPVVVCVDESGSMGGEPIWNAKAFALAMAMMAKQQGRWCALVGYSGGTEGTRLALPPGKWDQAKLIEWLVHFFAGGTTLDVPIVEVPKWWGTQELAGLPHGKTDLILITDAIVDVPDSMAAPFNSWKKENKVKTMSLVIGRDAGQLNKISDEIHLVKGISTDEEGVAKALSL